MESNLIAIKKHSSFFSSIKKLSKSEVVEQMCTLLEHDDINVRGFVLHIILVIDFEHTHGGRLSNYAINIIDDLITQMHNTNISLLTDLRAEHMHLLLRSSCCCFGAGSGLNNLMEHILDSQKFTQKELELFSIKKRANTTRNLKKEVITQRICVLLDNLNPEVRTQTMNIVMVLNSNRNLGNQFAALQINEYAYNICDQTQSDLRINGDIYQVLKGWFAAGCIMDIIQHIDNSKIITQDEKDLLHKDITPIDVANLSLQPYIGLVSPTSNYNTFINTPTVGSYYEKSHGKRGFMSPTVNINNNTKYISRINDQ